jgi:hypothetical protein
MPIRPHHGDSVRENRFLPLCTFHAAIRIERLSLIVPNVISRHQPVLMLAAIFSFYHAVTPDRAPWFPLCLHPDHTTRRIKSFPQCSHPGHVPAVVYNFLSRRYPDLTMRIIIVIFFIVVILNCSSYHCAVRIPGNESIHCNNKNLLIHARSRNVNLCRINLDILHGVEMQKLRSSTLQKMSSDKS